MINKKVEKGNPRTFPDPKLTVSKGSYIYAHDMIWRISSITWINIAVKLKPTERIFLKKENASYNNHYLVYHT